MPVQGSWKPASPRPTGRAIPIPAAPLPPSPSGDGRRFPTSRPWMPRRPTSVSFPTDVRREQGPECASAGQSPIPSMVIAETQPQPPAKSGPDQGESMTRSARPARVARPTVKVLLAIFDFPMLSLGFRAAIETVPGLEVIGEVADREALPDYLEALPADVVIAECSSYNNGSGLAMGAIEAARAARPAAKIIALECGTGSEQFSLALKAGAQGFLTREASPEDILNAIACVERGDTYVSPRIVTKMVNTYLLRNGEGTLEDAYDSLSDREREVLLLAATGHTNREIAKIFHLSEQTIHNYRAGVMEKLGFHDRVDLLKFAIRRGVINVADL
jgi:DNA-binding NarL/FixJ family response regulator